MARAGGGPGRRRVHADRVRRPGLRGGVPAELPPRGRSRQPALRRHDPAQQHLGRDRGPRGFPPDPLRAARPAVPRTRERPVTLLPYLVAVWLFVIGLYGIVTSRNLIHLIVCLSVSQ